MALSLNFKIVQFCAARSRTAMVVCYTRRMTTRSRKTAQLRADGRFWLTLEGMNFLGRGRVELLQRIRETGSISKAAKAMKMSYKAAWDAVDAINSAWQSPLVESGPGGSRLTEDAERLITAFLKAEARHTVFLEKLAETL
ncbi:MAG TPA: LysR family transcriptional regulator [Thiobacillus sp.]|nr:LysR family transcriptional regulator [Thiobacillus sp.]